MAEGYAVKETLTAELGGKEATREVLLKAMRAHDEIKQSAMNDVVKAGFEPERLIWHYDATGNETLSYQPEGKATAMGMAYPPLKAIGRLTFETLVEDGQAILRCIWRPL